MTAARLTAIVLLSVLMASVGCNPAPDTVENIGPEAFVSIPPLAFFARRIAGQHVTVNVLIKPGANPHTYAPTSKQIVRLNRGGLLICAGSGFEQIISSRLKWADGGLRIVNVAEGLGGQPHGAHNHHAADAHDHGDDDRHVWMSPRIAKMLAAAVCRELCTLDPPRSNDYQNNLVKLQADLDKLDARLSEALAPLKGKTLFVFHPAFGHFAKAYGLKQEAVESQGKSPGPKNITELIARAKAAGAKVIFVQPQFSQRSAEIIAKRIGGRVVPLDPLSGDYINNLEHIAEEFQKALAP